MAVGVLVGLDLDTVGVVRAHVMQRHDVRDHQTDQHERQRHDVQRKEAIERGIANDEVTANPGRELLADHRDSREQRDDHLRTPVGHIAPRQHVAHEGLGHQRQEDQAAEDPQQLARLAVRAVQQSAEHVQIDHDKEERCTRGMHVANQPAPFHVAHDVGDRAERLGSGRLVEHREPDTGEQLVGQHQHGQRAKVVPDVEVLRGVVLADVFVPQLGRREPGIDPVHELACHFTQPPRRPGSDPRLPL